MFPLPRHPNLAKSLRSLKGVGPQLEVHFQNKGYKTVSDLLALMPVRYQDRRGLTSMDRLEAEKEVLCGGRVLSCQEKYLKGPRRKLYEVEVSDGRGQLTATWFRLPAHLRRTLKKGDTLLLYGRVKDFRGRFHLLHPEILPWNDDLSPEPEIRPIYPEIAQIKPGVLRRVMDRASLELSYVPAAFPLSWLKEHDLSDPIDSLVTLHRPPGGGTGPVPVPEESRAWTNLALFELLFIQINLARFRIRLKQEPGLAFPLQSRLTDKYLDALPFRLTATQTKALREIKQDMSRPEPMNRLLQGDVGSGKTVIAMAAALTCADGGFQTAFMAPTEIVARQHFQALLPYARELGVETEVLVGELPESEKQVRRDRLASGETRIVFGTHALISSQVEFKALGLVVIDEQHRFGVGQRLALKSKAARPDMLIMTATPIPRSLALTLYGDLDLSSITELPPGRRPITTRLFGRENRESAYGELAREVLDRGGQAFVIAPRIEAGGGGDESGEDLTAAENLFRHITAKVTPNMPVALLHGRLPSDEQRAVLEAFHRGEIKVLVSTTIVEVGLDVENASLILIEGADRFGLAQLHQLRGRVGRGPKPAACLLVSEHTEGPAGERLKALLKTNDGFELAEEDLRIRGPGDATGLKQSGLPPLSFARLPRDLALLKKARDLAREIVDQDPELNDPKFRLVREIIDQMDERIKVEVGEVG